jgi:hypothetical protein
MAWHGMAWHGMVQYSINAVQSVSAERAVIRWNLRVPVLRCCAAAEWIRTDHPWARTSRIELPRSDACWKPGGARLVLLLLPFCIGINMQAGKSAIRTRKAV